MGHEVRITSSFPSALGGEAFVVQSYPARSTNDPPVYFHGGHGVNPEKYLRYMAEAHGRHAFSIVYPGKRPRDDVYLVREDSTEYQVQRRDVRRKAATFAGPIVSKGQLALAEDLLTIVDKLDTTDAVGQSIGVLSLTQAVFMNSHKFSKVTLTHPAGMIKPDFRRLLPSGLRYVQAWWNRTSGGPEDSIQRYLGDYRPILPDKSPRNVAANGDNVILSYHAPLLESIKNSSENAPFMTIVAGKDDYIFSPGRIMQHVAADTIDQFVVVAGSHAIGDRKSVMDRVMHTLKPSGNPKVQF